MNFEDRRGPSGFAAAGAAQTLTYDLGGYTATFTGGVILTGEVGQTVDNSSVYATIGGNDFGPGLTNPLVITFSAPIKNFQIDILNAFAGSYAMTDNAGNSVNFTLTSANGSAVRTVGFAAAGTVVSIKYLDVYPTYLWDFAIDNVTFNQPLAVPEPATWLLMAAGALGIVVRRRNVPNAARRA